jgi:hypothetical protein
LDLVEFLADTSLSGDVTQGELAFLKSLKLNGRRPTRIYYYPRASKAPRPAEFWRAACSTSFLPNETVSSIEPPTPGIHTDSVDEIELRKLDVAEMSGFAVTPLESNADCQLSECTQISFG